jgi:NAD(P)-dependent dehydrogenase (short-subunit alcohol dehydrogenase family)
METVLVVGSTGNIGASAVTAALRSKRQVLAIVRNQSSADKLIKNIGSSDGITFVEADVLSDSGVKGVVDQVRAGKLPTFQHVYSCGLLPLIPTEPMLTTDISIQLAANIRQPPSRKSLPASYAII